MKKTPKSASKSRVRASSKANPQVQEERLLMRFKLAVEAKLGQVDWKKWGKASLAVLILAAASGILGPKPAALARGLLKLAAVA